MLPKILSSLDVTAVNIEGKVPPGTTFLEFTKLPKIEAPKTARTMVQFGAKRKSS